MDVRLDDMNYQLTILISNKLEEKARQAVLDVVGKDLGDKSKSENWGVRGLAYPIKHEEKAYYAHFNFETDPATIPTIDRKLKLNEDIIRYLLIKIEAKKQKTLKKSTSIKIEKKDSKPEKTEEVAAEAEETESVEETEAPKESK